MRIAGCVFSLVAMLWAGAASPEDPDQLIQAGHWKRAKPLLEAAYGKNPKDVHTLVLMARLKRLSGDLAGAQKLTEQAVASDANSFEAHMLLAEILGDQADKASVFRKMSLAGAVRREIETAARLNPDSVDAHWGLMKYYLQAPGIVGGNKDKARQEQATIAKLSVADGFLAGAEITRHGSKTADVGVFYRKAHEAAPQNYEVQVSYCNYLLNQKNWPFAENCGSDLVKLDPLRVSGYSVLAVAYSSEQKWKELEATLVGGEKNVPDDRAPSFYAGRTLADSGVDNSRGERYLRHYLEQQPELGGPKTSRAHWRLGQILEKQGRKNDALAEYRAATGMEPSFEPAQKDLKRLR